ncbi:histidine kinase dimerization/phosphoacceptor domain -containing protein [Bradyrhizobium sp. LHD-71]|uniref:sensor histidine kinase n=1 Tax=Bradyrhizobium sp. LHD-71 TaxID=3072141 RepID=UPI00280F27F2|nr:histidine kinase dimerization/phosphoacceptor domain -containing protein [Bradyrhizobium sp. LHD-71]MDQ8732128.1 histidine kinase dimerization/phosphoacceptor domain -containing protein [Bradyrhizobium sp. LHD-71]
MDLTRRLYRLRHDRLLSMLIALGIFAVALGLRMVLPDSGIPFITFYPAVIVAGYLVGAWPGLLVMLLSELAVYFVFSSRPMFLGYDAPNFLVPFGIFTAASVFVLAFMHFLHRTADKLWVEREKSNAMFSELQHRVANNMQLVASVLQLERTTERSKAESLLAAQRRLELLGTIHRRLYDPSASEKPVTTHLLVLCDELVRAEGRNDVAIEVEPSSLMLGPERLILLSLLTAEIVTNSLKHAFKQTGGRIAVRINHLVNPCEMIISDNGIGIASGEEALGSSLGRSIINSLAANLRGTVEYAGNEGTTVKLTFERD